MRRRLSQIPPPINGLNNFDNIGEVKGKLGQPCIALVRLRAIAGQKLGRNHVPNNIHHPYSEEGHTILLSDAGLKFITDFIIATIQELRRTMLVTLFARLVSFGASASAIGQPSCCVMHRHCREASAHTISAAF